MSGAGRICVRPLADLMQENSSASENFSLLLKQPPVESISEGSPLKAGKKTRRKAATTGRKAKAEQIVANSTVKKSQTNKKILKIGEGQKTIDSFFKSASKNFQIEPNKDCLQSKSTKKQAVKKTRRRISFSDTTTASNASKFSDTTMRKTNKKPTEFIDLCASDSEHENKIVATVQQKTKKPRNRRILSSSSSENSEKTLRSILPQRSARKTPKKLTDTIKTKTPKKKSSREKSNNLVRQNDNPAKSPTVKTKKTANKRKSIDDEQEMSVVSKSKKLQDNIEMEDKNETTKNNNLQDSESLDEIIPPSLENEVVSARKQRKNSSFNLTFNNKKVAKNQIEIVPTTVKTSPVIDAMQNQTIVFEPLVSIFENSPPTTSNSQTNVTSCNGARNDKENCEPVTPPLSSLIRFNATKELACSTIEETTLVTTEINADIIDISDGDFEYVETKTSKKITRIKSKNARQIPRNNQNNEPAVKKSKKIRPVPPYKIVEGTNGTMAVDAFNFGDITGVQHYFLTHFHADHYIGLTRKFAHDIYMSSITARLVRSFIPIEEQYIKEIQLNVPIMIDDIEVTAIDANHCPGAVMLIFKLPDGRCMLHTGDFRASAEMESEPIFWNNDIHTIYLDTTYINQKHAFCHQSESIELAKRYMDDFIIKNVGTRMLFVCGSYLIGKEKFWSALARHFNFKVFAEGNRRKSLMALEDETLNELLTENVNEAQMHVIPLGKMGYDALTAYLDKYADNFDVIFALRPSGWEMNSKPQYRGKINIFGIEYSEHSSRDEMQRFVQYLKPKNVISTVPVTGDAMITAKVPKEWYQYTTLKRQYQPSITSYFKTKSTTYFQQLKKKYTTLAAHNSKLKNVNDETMLSDPPLMLISPDVDVEKVAIVTKAVKQSPAKVSAIEIPLETLVPNVKPKEEVLSKVPVLNDTIVIDCDTDDDWLT